MNGLMTIHPQGAALLRCAVQFVLLTNCRPPLAGFSLTYSITKTAEAALVMERVEGIEPSYSAWKADVLPLNYTRIRFLLKVESW